MAFSQSDQTKNKTKTEIKKMKVEIKNGCLVIEMPMGSLAPSKSGKTLLVASSHGNQPTAALVDGKPVVVSVNAYVKR